MDPKPDFLISGVLETPRIINKEILDSKFRRENLSSVVLKVLDTASKNPVDVEYLERQIRIWNDMEQSKRGFKGNSSVYYKERKSGGTLNILYFPESDSVKLDWQPSNLK